LASIPFKINLKLLLGTEKFPLLISLIELNVCWTQARVAKVKAEVFCLKNIFNCKQNTKKPRTTQHRSEHG